MKHSDNKLILAQTTVVLVLLFFWFVFLSWFVQVRERVKSIPPIEERYQHEVEEKEFTFKSPEVKKVPKTEPYAIKQTKTAWPVENYILEEEATTQPLTGKELYVSYIEDICKDKDFIDDLPYLVQAVMEVESNFNPNVSHPSANCVGLMQVSIVWQSDRAAKLGVQDIWDPYGNILVAVDLIEDLYFNYAHQDLPLTIMMYNMDFTSARRIRAAGGTTAYADKVLSIYDELKGQGYSYA